VLYWDDDDDLIPINSQDELSEAFKVGNCNVHMTSLTFCSGETQTMSHIVESCPLTKLNGGLSRLHTADEDAVSWLTSLLLLLVCVSFTIIGQPRNSVLIRRV